MTRVPPGTAALWLKGVVVGLIAAVAAVLLVIVGVQLVLIAEVAINSARSGGGSWDASVPMTSAVPLVAALVGFVGGLVWTVADGVRS